MDGILKLLFPAPNLKVVPMHEFQATILARFEDLSLCFLEDFILNALNICDDEDVLKFLSGDKETRRAFDSYLGLFSGCPCESLSGGSVQSLTTWGVGQSSEMRDGNVISSHFSLHSTSISKEKIKIVLPRYLRSFRFITYLKDFLQDAYCKAKRFRQIRTTIPQLLTQKPSSWFNIPVAEVSSLIDYSDGVRSPEISVSTSNIATEAQILEGKYVDHTSAECRNFRPLARAEACTSGYKSSYDALYAIDPIELDDLLNSSSWLFPLVAAVEKIPIAACLLKVESKLYNGYPVIYANPRFQEITKFQRTEILGEDFLWLLRSPYGIPVSPDESSSSTMIALLRSRSPAEVSMRLYRRDGRCFECLVCTKPIFNKQSRQIYSLITILPYDKFVWNGFHLARKVNLMNCCIPDVV